MTVQQNPNRPPPTRTPTRVEQVINMIRRNIANRRLASGARLPSIRQCATDMSVSKSTVVEAYDRLAAEGVITARRGSGFYVASHLPPLSIAEIGPRLDREIDPFWVSRQSLEAGETMLKPGCGWLPADWMPEEALRRALRQAARTDLPELTDYGRPLGLPALRRLLANRMIDHGIEVSPDQILLAESGTQAIDMLLRIMISPGDGVIVDDPCYFNFHALLRAHRATIHAVPFDQNGPDPAAFADIVATHRPRLYITNSGIHNPTGATLSPMVAHKVLKTAEQFDLAIIEDDIFADFEITPAPRLAAFDGLDRVVHIGSFSKTLSAASRCGFIAARPDWIEKLTDLKIATTFGGNRLGGQLVHSLLADGSYRRHLVGLRSRLADHMGLTQTRLARLGITPWLVPDGGMFLWTSLPDGLDAAEIARIALRHGVIFAPGNVFSASHSAPGFMRFNVGQSSDPRIFDVLETAMEQSVRPEG